jgi:hypothetical protein
MSDQIEYLVTKFMRGLERAWRKSAEKLDEMPPQAMTPEIRRRISACLRTIYQELGVVIFKLEGRL